jgi:hypothetical protein
MKQDLVCDANAGIRCLRVRARHNVEFARKVNSHFLNAIMDNNNLVNVVPLRPVGSLRNFLTHIGGAVESSRSVCVVAVRHHFVSYIISPGLPLKRRLPHSIR